MKAQGLARIGRDAEVRFTTGGEAVASLSLAFSYGKKDQTTGKRPTQWVDAALWGKRAEALAPYLTKGSQVVAYLDEVHIETFTKSDGTQSTKLAARVTDIELIASGEPAAPRQQPPAQRPAPAKASTGSGFDDMDDDVPF